MADLKHLGTILMIKIRRAEASDIPRLVALNRLAQEKHADAFPERFRRDALEPVVAGAFTAMIEAPSAYWLVAGEEEPVGFLSAEFRDGAESWCLVSRRVCYLAGLIVAPGFRRQGIARALVAALRLEADSRGVTQIELDVWGFNGEAKEAFAKLGFKPLMEKMALSAGEPKQAPANPGPTAASRGDRTER